MSLEWVNSPWVVLVTSGATILSMIAAGYFYYRSQIKSQLVYTLSTTRTVFDSSKSSDFEIYHKGKKIDGSISAVRVEIENIGNKEIYREGVFSPCNDEHYLVMKTLPWVEILEAKPIKKPDSITGFDVINPLNEEGHILFFWRILPPHHKGSIQVIFKGDKDIDVGFEGYVADQRKPIYNKKKIISRKFYLSIIFALVLNLISIYITGNDLFQSIIKLIVLIILVLIIGIIVIYVLQSDLGPY